MNKHYLENSICKFTPLFKINYLKKKNIFSGVFFKLKKGSYKKFSLYLYGIKKLLKYIKNNYNDYTLRLFIDDSIYNDKTYGYTVLCPGIETDSGKVFVRDLCKLNLS